MTAADVVAVVNPSKIEDLAAFRDQVEAAATAHGGSPIDWLETTPEDPGYGQAQQAVQRQADLVLACGGDGTVTACAAALAGTSTALGLIPAGTGNLLARNLDLPIDLDEALDIAFGPGRKAIDLVRTEPGRYFSVMAGVGFDAAMIAETDEDAKAKIGWPAYLGGVVRAMRRSQRAEFTVRVDDEPACVRQGVGVLIGNVGRLQAGLSMFPEASPTDGVIDLTILAPTTWRDWPVIAGRLLTHRLHVGGRTELLRGQRFEIEISRSLPVEFDGDVFGSTRTLTAEVVPHALTLCVAP